MKLTVLGGSGAWPPARGACSGYLLEHAGFQLLVDPGYATLPRLLELLPAERVDAVLVSHGHPDHCADLNPLLRAPVLEGSPPPLAVHSLPDALGPVLALDLPRMLAGSYALHEFAAGARFDVGPFAVETMALPHFVPNAGLRIATAGLVVVYSGDAAPTPDFTRLAAGADLLLAEATFPEKVPEAQAAGLSTALDAGRTATAAHAGRLVLTHLWPGTDPAVARRAAASRYAGEIAVAAPGLTIELE